MIQPAVLLALLALLVGACASGPPPASPRSRGPAPGPSLTAEPIQPEESGVVTGTLGFDAIEAGCGYLETSDGKRYQVIYPDGWRLDRATGRLLGPDGQSVGPGGLVSVRGSIATDIASICQVGPMFRAVEVLRAGD